MGDEGGDHCIMILIFKSESGLNTKLFSHPF